MCAAAKTLFLVSQACERDRLRRIDHERAGARPFREDGEPKAPDPKAMVTSEAHDGQTYALKSLHGHPAWVRLTKRG